MLKTFQSNGVIYSTGKQICKVDLLIVQEMKFRILNLLCFLTSYAHLPTMKFRRKRKMADFKIPHPRLQNFKCSHFCSHFWRIRDFNAGGHAHHRLALVPRGGLSECFLYYPCDKIEDGGPLWCRLFPHFLFEPVFGRETSSPVVVFDSGGTIQAPPWEVETKRLQVLILVASIFFRYLLLHPGRASGKTFCSLLMPLLSASIDPLFNKDISFYIFSLPFFTHIYSSVMFTLSSPSERLHLYI